MADDGRLTLGVVDHELRFGGDDGSEAMHTTEALLTSKGSGWRANLNAVAIVVADAHGISTARATARTLAAMRDLLNDRHRLSRFNAEQKERLTKHAGDAEERLPQQVVMAYRHLLTLRDANGEGVKVDRSDLGPARMGATITDRVAAYLRDADRLVEERLAPAALLSSRFAVIPEDQHAVELDRLLGYFAQYPRLPMLGSPDVLRRALTAGVEAGQFALVSGGSWEASDALIQFRKRVTVDEIVFQPGTWIVRAGAAEALLRKRTNDEETKDATSSFDDAPTVAGESGTVPTVGYTGRPADAPSGELADERPRRGDDRLARVTLRIGGIPGHQMRDVVKTAVIPLMTDGEVTVDVTVSVDSGHRGISRQTLDLIVREGLRQLGLVDVDIDESRE